MTYSRIPVCISHIWEAVYGIHESKQSIVHTAFVIHNISTFGAYSIAEFQRRHECIKQ